MNPRTLCGICLRLTLLVSVWLLTGCQIPLAAWPLTSVLTPPEPTAVRELTLLGRIGGPSIAVAAHGSYALIGYRYELAVLDMADPAHPHRVAYLPISTNDIALVGAYAYLAGRHGLSIFDSSDSTAPALAAVYDTPDDARSIAVANGAIYAADPFGGLLLLARPTPAQIAQVAQE